MCDVGVRFTGTPFFVLVSNMTSVILWIHYSHISCACLPVKPNGIIITEELREELHQAALATTQAYVGARNASAGNGNKVCIESLCVVLVKLKAHTILIWDILLQQRVFPQVIMNSRVSHHTSVFKACTGLMWDITLEQGLFLQVVL